MKDQLIADLKRDEGWRGYAYRDSEGWWTIGYGRLIDRRKGGRITRAEGLMLLENDVAWRLAKLEETLSGWDAMPEDVRRGLVNMTYNVGFRGLLLFEKMLAALRAGDYRRAADEALDSKWAGQVGPRADRIAALFRGCAD